MSETVAFLTALAQALSALALYPTGHASRERAIDGAYQHLLDLLAREHLLRTKTSEKI